MNKLEKYKDIFRRGQTSEFIKLSYELSFNATKCEENLQGVIHDNIIWFISIIKSEKVLCLFDIETNEMTIGSGLTEIMEVPISLGYERISGRSYTLLKEEEECKGLC